MTDWEPATEVEAAMRDALRAGDQELYFRILARSELLLPVSSEALAGRAPVGWGTWTTNGRTHVLAFTSGEALRVCLADNAGSARRMPYHDLAASWPNLEWWLAVNPGLPIEGYLPAWFVSQLARGDVRLPGRTMGARARLDRAESAARARARATVPGQVVQGEIVEPPFVDRAAAAVGPVLEPDSIEPPQRNRPTRPPGYDSPLASIRRRAGVAPTDATPSSPATPPPYRPVPQPQVTDVTPHRSQPSGNGYDRQPAANGEATAWPPPVVQGGPPPRRPLRPPVEPPREVIDQSAPPMRPRSPFRDDPARATPPARFGAPPPVPQPPARPTSGGGFFGGAEADPEPPRRPATPGWPGQPAARDDPRQTNWSPANAAASASVPTETRPSAGTPTASPTPPRPAPGRDPGAPGWADSTPPARPAPAWPAAAAPAPQARPGSVTPGGSDSPGSRGPQARPEHPPRQTDSAPLPVRRPGSPPASGAAAATVGQLWPDHPVTGPTRAAEAAPPRPDDRPSDAGTPGATPPGRAWPEQPPAGKPGRSASTLAKVWSNRGSAAAPEGSTAIPAGSPTPAAPQLWADSKPPSTPEVPARAEPPRPASAAPQRWPNDASPAQAPGGRSHTASAQVGSDSRPSPGTAQSPAVSQLRPDGTSSAEAGRADRSSATAAQMWSDSKPSPGVPAGADRPAAIPSATTDLWSDSKPPSDVPSDAERSSAATNRWSDGNPSDVPAAAARPQAVPSAATDLWSDSTPSSEPARSAVADVWSDSSSADVSDGSDSAKAAASARTDSRSSAGADGPRSASTAATDLWSDSGSSSDMSGGADGPRAASSAATDLWSDSRPSSDMSRAADELRAASGAATDLWSDSGSSSDVSGGADRPRAASSAATDLWSDSTSSDESSATSPAGAGRSPTADSAADLWSDSKAPDVPAEAERSSAAGALADLWADGRPSAGAGSTATADAARMRSESQTPSQAQAGTDRSPAASDAAPDLWSDSKPPADTQRSQAAPGAAAQAWSGSEPANAGVAAETWSDGGALAAPQQPDTDGPEGVKPHANTAAQSWSEAGTAEKPQTSGLWSDSAAPSEAGTAEPSAAEMWLDRAAAAEKAPEPSATEIWHDRTPSPSDDAPAAATDSSYAELWLDHDDAAAAAEAPRGEDQRWAPGPVDAQPDAADLWRDSAPATQTEAATQGSDPHAGWSSSTPVTPFAAADAPSTSQAWATAPTPSWLDQAAPAAGQPPADTSLFTAEVPADFRPANDVEESLLTAAGSGNTDTFLSTLLLARVLLPVSSDSSAGAKPGGDGFVWRTETIDDQPYVVVFTSPERMAEHLDNGHETVTVKFVRLISRWPQENWSFAVNPGTPVGAKLPGAQIVALASWAAEVGLDAGDDEPVVAAAPKQEAPKPAPAPAAVDAALPTMMQKTIAPSQVDYYLERGYDRVSGFVHRVAEVSHLSSPAQLFTALGLGYANSPFDAGADEVYVLRWPAYRPSLYRIPYGGQNETAMRAMEGWVIERGPFRGNGFAPGEGSEVIAEFKVDSARLPHGAQLWLIRADGSEKLVAVLDADAPGWNRVDDQ
ncbi:type III secretion system (T3SS) SseB-like protein [Asanoa ferruginea]|uniref:Type III secretion system (T3SS) SseB-like protein n=1 Tax=Asanoa ferruginea TaxID=53367 RepID=A0A3D9ZEM1_9ACTN|nr:SseB family protein [Asanoa ferruginea]REF95741.1 type III secretion system (T3SS) SseB-like protein [Asanoa ferruginea]GIF53283.1 hypothetical protein Afe04nite_78220 [Asanoa ferruginea]